MYKNNIKNKNHPNKLSEINFKLKNLFVCQNKLDKVIT